MKITICHSKRVFFLNNSLKTLINKEDLDNGFENFKIDMERDGYMNEKNVYSMYN